MRRTLIFSILLIFVLVPLFMKREEIFSIKVTQTVVSPYERLGYSKEEEEVLTHLLSEEECAYIIENHIEKDILFPYLAYQAFNLYQLNAYESVRVEQHLSHLQAMNTVNHPYLTREFYTHPKKALFQDTDLILVNKNYYLDESYIPSDLVLAENIKKVIPGDYPRNYVKQEVYDALRLLFKDAELNGVNLFYSSGYRAYTTQKDIYDYYKTHLDNPDAVSARPGFSEHQTGLAVDLTCKEVDYQLKDSFELTSAGRFIKDRAYLYGFVVRYMVDKESITGYRYEPWHLRYVGKQAAKIIHDEQITLEEYLLKYTELPK